MSVTSTILPLAADAELGVDAAKAIALGLALASEPSARASASAT